MPMCSELGPEGGLLPDYIMEAAGTSLCSIDDYVGCSEKEVAYVKKHATSDRSKIDAQILRLQGMVEGKMQPDLKIWIKQRLAILKSYQKNLGGKVEL